MVKSIVLFGDPVLRRKASQVKGIDNQVKELIRDLKHTIKVEGGVGLAANQIGELKRVIVLREIGEEQEPERVFPLINPEIMRKEGEQRDEEGCLSFPELYVPITRAEKVLVTYMDENGNIMEEEFSGLLARAVQHELDHLDGILFIDRVDKEDKESLEKIRNWKKEFMLSKVVKNRMG